MKQRSSLLMRVLLCKIQCPSLFSFCTPSRAPHLYTHSSLKSENTVNVENVENVENSNLVSVVSIVDANDGCEKVNGSNSDWNEQDYDNEIKSCIGKRVCKESGNGKEKKKVQWVDNFGKELVEIKEFESSETDTDELENRICSCLIL